MRCRREVEPVREHPRADAQQVTQALLDEPLEVEEHRDGWARIVTAYGYPGWIREEAIGAGTGSLPWPSGADVLTVAMEYVGAPYEWGGLTRNGIDCSGLVHMAYRLTGRLVPRDSWQQEAAGTPVDAGDDFALTLVSYGDGARADHVAFLLGDGRILHATAHDRLGVVIRAGAAGTLGPPPPRLLALDVRPD